MAALQDATDVELEMPWKNDGHDLVGSMLCEFVPHDENFA